MLETQLKEKKEEEIAIDKEIVEFNKRMNEILNLNKDRGNQLKNLETNIANQKKIYDEFCSKIEYKKTESAQFIEKLKQQQKVLDSKYVRIGKNLKGLVDIQEELAFFYEAHATKTGTNTRFLEYVKNFETKASLSALKQKLNIDSTVEIKHREEKNKAANDDPENQGEGGGSKTEPFSFKQFKDILKGVLKENT